VRKLNLLLMLCLCGLSARGAFLRDVPVTVRQPNGSMLQCFASGDEFYNWLHDRKGFTIIQDQATGYYVYARLRDDRLVPSPTIAGAADPAEAGYAPWTNISSVAEIQIRASMPWYEPPAQALAPRTGVLNNVVIFIRFSDEAEFTDPASKYINAFNLTTPGASSMYNYFMEVSYGRLEVFTSFFPANTGTTVLSYQDTQPRAYYLPYSTTNTTGYTTDQYTRERELLLRAVAAVAAQVPAGLVIDGDNDGYADNVCFIVRGTPSAWATLLWPHMSSMGSSGPTIGTKKVNAYNLQIESMANVSVFSHEMMHSLGAPDTYRYSSPDGVIPCGAWDVMASTGNPPQHTGAYIRYRYTTWISSMPRITVSGRYALHPVSTPTNNCYRIDSPNPGEFFVLEYRKRNSIFENTLGSDGLLIYRIDSLVHGNAGGPPDGIYIYRPGGNPGDSWPGNGSLSLAVFRADIGHTAINDTTNPACILTSGAPGNLDISDIGDIGDSISFTVTIKTKQPGWTASTLAPANEIYGSTWPTPQTGWICGNAVLFKSTNGGTSWSNLPSRPNTTLYGVSATDNVRCWAIGSTSVYSTTDGGSTWQSSFLTVPGGRLYAISMISGMTGWLAGTGGTMYKTINGGSNWTLVTPGTPRILRSVFFKDEAHGWAVGDGGTIASTADSGKNWTVRTLSDTLAFNAVAFTDTLVGCVAGRYGRVYRTTNGGTSWAVQSIPTRSHLNAIAFRGRDSGWIAGDNGTILRTVDGGRTWSAMVSGTMVSLRCIGTPGGPTQWVSGASGILLRSASTATGDVPEYAAGEPYAFALEQNYPNPFNPASDIRYQISEFRIVKLAVYDLLGREVAELVNEPKAPGEYKVRFDARGLSSGMYFYRLQAGSLTETKKMMLLK
jgi:M6 family metalloprotease-like protein